MFLYYSGLVDGTAAKRHPEWRALKQDGQPHPDAEPFHMVPICPDSRYFEEWVAVHLEEMLTRYDPDGIWVDGDWGGEGVCYCPTCKDLCTRLFGANAINGSQFHIWARNEFRRKVSALVRLYKPSCLFSTGNTTPAVDAGLVNHLDWQSGDWYSPADHRIRQSLAMRRYTTLGIPYDAMTCDTQCIWRNGRSRVKTVQRMMQEGAGVLSNGGKWCYWTYPMPNGALIPSRVRMAKVCRDFAREREDLWLGTQSARWVAVVDALPRPLSNHGNESFLGAAKALVELHLSPDLIHANQLKDPIPYETLVIADQPSLTQEHAALLDRFVRGGGTLVTTGQTAQIPEIANLLGIKLVPDGSLNEGHVILSDGTPAGIYTMWSKLKLDGAEAWWKLYKSWDQDNPDFRFPLSYQITGMLDEENPEEAGFPAVTARKLGRGIAVHIAGDPFAEYWTYGYPTTRRFLAELLDRVQPIPRFQCDAPSWVEVALRVRPGELLVHFINGNPGRDLCQTDTSDLFVDEIPQFGPVATSVRCDRSPKEVFLDPGHQPLKYDWREGRLHFAVPSLHIHSCVRVRPWHSA